MLPHRIREVHTAARRPADAALGPILTRAMQDGVGPAALDAVAAEAAAARAAGRSPNQVAVRVRQALAVAAPGAMTAVAFDAVARRLVQHALRSYFESAERAPEPV